MILLRPGRPLSGRLLAYSAASLIVAANCILIGGSQVSAEVYTCGSTSSSNYHDGYTQPFNGSGSREYEGAYAVVRTEYGAVCDTVHTTNNFTNSYVMIASNDVSGWSQVGFLRWYNSTTVWFAQYHDRAEGVGNYPTKFGTTTLTDGSTYGYSEHWDPTTGKEKNLISGTDFYNTSFNPFSQWTLPFDAQYDGEAVYKQSDVPGNASSPTTFTSIQGQQQSNDNYVSVPCNYLDKGNDGAATRADGEAWYDRLAGSCPGFEIYTDTAGH